MEGWTTKDKGWIELMVPMKGNGSAEKEIKMIEYAEHWGWEAEAEAQNCLFLEEVIQ